MGVGANIGNDKSLISLMIIFLALNGSNSRKSPLATSWTFTRLGLEAAKRKC